LARVVEGIDQSETEYVGSMSFIGRSKKGRPRLVETGTTSWLPVTDDDEWLADGAVGPFRT
jgi:hypothetical protein